MERPSLKIWTESAGRLSVKARFADAGPNVAFCIADASTVTAASTMLLIPGLRKSDPGLLDVTKIELTETFEETG